MSVLNDFVEIKIAEQEDFLKIKETLTRIGVASKKGKTLFQSCHILHKQGRYFIVHFKEMFLLDNKPTNFTDEDKGRRNKIIELLQDWNLITVVNEDQIKIPTVSMNQIKVLSHKEKPEWVLEAKYNMGKKKNEKT